MRYILDSNTCIFLIKKKPENVLKRLKAAMQDGIAMSAITLAELEFGIAKSEHKQKNADALAQFLSIVDILPFESKAAIAYGEIRADLQRKGLVIGSLDMLIAAHAKACNLILVTNNVQDFGRVEGLRIEDWVN